MPGQTFRADSKSCSTQMQGLSLHLRITECSQLQTGFAPPSLRQEGASAPRVPRLSSPLPLPPLRGRPCLPRRRELEYPGPAPSSIPPLPPPPPSSNHPGRLWPSRGGSWQGGGVSAGQGSRGGPGARLAARCWAMSPWSLAPERRPHGAGPPCSDGCRTNRLYVVLGFLPPHACTHLRTPTGTFSTAQISEIKARFRVILPGQFYRSSPACSIPEFPPVGILEGTSFVSGQSKPKR